MKTNKSFAKRIKKTKTGKLVARKIGQNHLNAKATGSKKMKKKRTVIINISNKARGQLLNKLIIHSK